MAADGVMIQGHVHSERGNLCLVEQAASARILQSLIAKLGSADRTPGKETNGAAPIHTPAAGITTVSALVWNSVIVNFSPFSCARLQCANTQWLFGSSTANPSWIAAAFNS